MKICLALLVCCLAIWADAQKPTPSQDITTIHRIFREAGLSSTTERVKNNDDKNCENEHDRTKPCTKTATSQSTSEIRRLRQSGISLTTEKSSDSKRTTGRVTMRSPIRRQTEKDDARRTETSTRKLSETTKKDNDRKRRNPQDDQTPPPDNIDRHQSNMHWSDEAPNSNEEFLVARFRRAALAVNDDGREEDDDETNNNDAKHEHGADNESQEHESDGSNKQRRQAGQQLPMEQQPSTVSDFNAHPNTRVQRQQAPSPAAPESAPGAPGKGAEQGADLSSRGRPQPPVRPVRPPPPPPAQGGSELTLPDGYQTIVNPVNPGFTCDQKIYGYYADTYNECKVFHVCIPVTNEHGDVGIPIQWSFICGNQTLFNQEKLTCDYKDRVDCSRAQDYYNVNENFGKIDNPSGLGSAPNGK